MAVGTHETTVGLMASVVMVGEMTGCNVPRLERLGWGRMWVARGRNISTYPGEPWGFDNGAFRDWRDGVPFDESAYAGRLDRARGAGIPYLAILPDIVGGGAASLAMSVRWLVKESDADWPWYLAVQDGMEPDDVEPFVDRLAGIFLGGTSRFKAQAGKWCEWAHEHGLRFHYGRAGTPLKVAHAMEIGADSLDSAFPLWTRERWQLFEEICRNGPCQFSFNLRSA
jgi:hypothetical protein